MCLFELLFTTVLVLNCLHFFYFNQSLRHLINVKTIFNFICINLTTINNFNQNYVFFFKNRQHISSNYNKFTEFFYTSILVIFILMTKSTSFFINIKIIINTLFCTCFREPTCFVTTIKLFSSI